MKIITWNIRVDSGYVTSTWTKRGLLLKEALLRELPDFLCVQEARKHQVDFLLDSFRRTHSYSYIGVGRENGEKKGEFCAIFYTTTTIDLIESGTFWLSLTPDRPSRGYDYYPRICTWGQFKEKQTRREFLVFNVHLPLAFNFYGKREAIEVVLRKIGNMGSAPVILAGDFNAGPSSVVWKKIYEPGFQRIPRTGRTSHFLGMPLFCFDAIFVSEECALREYCLLRDHKGLQYPSDHFGVLAEVDFGKI